MKITIVLNSMEEFQELLSGKIPSKGKVRGLYNVMVCPIIDCGRSCRRVNGASLYECEDHGVWRPYFEDQGEIV